MCARCPGPIPGFGAPGLMRRMPPLKRLHRHCGDPKPNMPLVSGRKSGSQLQSAPYQRPLTNTRPPAPPKLSRNVLRPACDSVGPCPIRSCLSWQTLVASLSETPWPCVTIPSSVVDSTPRNSRSWNDWTGACQSLAEEWTPRGRQHAVVRSRTAHPHKTAPIPRSPPPPRLSSANQPVTQQTCTPRARAPAPAVSQRCFISVLCFVGFPPGFCQRRGSRCCRGTIHCRGACSLLDMGLGRAMQGSGGMHSGVQRCLARVHPGVAVGPCGY